MNLKNMHWVNKDLEYKDVVYAILSIGLQGKIIIFIVYTAELRQ